MRLGALILLSWLLIGCGSSDRTSAGPAVGGSGGHGGTGGTGGGAGSGGTIGAAGAPDPLAQMRSACTFTAGAKVADTLGLTATDRAAIKLDHIIVMMKENRSFDHLLGHLHDRGQPDVEAIPPGLTNPDLAGKAFPIAHAPVTCISHDPDHQWSGMHMQVDSGKMDGFVKSAQLSTGTDGSLAMYTYDQPDLPFYYWLASTFALGDRHFPPVRSGTFPNRNFLLLGTADGVTATGAGYPDPATPTIFDALDKAGVTWGVYSDGSLLSGTLDWKLTHPGAHHFADFLAALDAGSLPQVVFVDGIDDVEDEHPTGDLQKGEAWTRNVYQHVIASPLWPTLAMVWTYDEAGGFFDHVPPPNQACVARPVDKDAKFTELGVRVPIAIISPWARPHHVSHDVHDHTAITRLIETVFDLPALTARDANSTALLDMFDFTGAPPLATPPPAPEAGHGGCGESVVLSATKPTYASGEPIVLSFSGAPGGDATDWIGIYSYTAMGPTPPGMGTLNWAYLGGSQTPSTMPTSGMVTLDASTNGKGGWPLPAGGYIAYYLLGKGYTSVASIDFNVQ